MIHLLIPHHFCIGFDGRACFVRGTKLNVRLYDLTGMVGQGGPLECLLNTDVSVVQTVGRTPAGDAGNHSYGNVSA
jgi:hypothetical protein